MLDYVNICLYFINYWLPWFNFLIESFALQVLIIYSIYTVYYNNNIYYILLFLTGTTFLVGVFLAVYQLELFTAFLWLVELSVFFVFLLLLFYVNIKGSFVSTNFKWYYGYFVIIGLFLSICIFTYYESDNLNTTLCLFLYDDYYSTVSNQINNDFYGLYVSYYCINSFEYIIVGFILLVGSVFCITIFKVCTTSTLNGYTPFFKVFNFFSDFVNFFFLRKQNLTKQGLNKELVRVFKKS